MWSDTIVGGRLIKGAKNNTYSANSNRMAAHACTAVTLDTAGFIIRNTSNRA
jgi:hypothetical protein